MHFCKWVYFVCSENPQTSSERELCLLSLCEDRGEIDLWGLSSYTNRTTANVGIEIRKETIQKY